MRILGNVERFDGRVISGWLAFKGDEADRPVLQVLCDGEVIGEGAADQRRDDLRDAGFGDGACAFEIAVPDAWAQQPQRLRLRIRGTEIYLTHPSFFGTEEASALAARGGPKVFVSGPARSGTSILFHALQHTLKLPGTGEGHILPVYQAMLYKFYTYAESFKANPGVLASHLDFAGFKAKLHADVRGIYDKLFPGGSFIDKTPGHEAIEALRIARAVFPDCRIVILRRNGLDVVNSFVAKFGAEFDAACIEWRDSVRATTALQVALPDILVLDHFLLRSQPHEAGRAIAAYLGVPDAATAIGTYFTENEVERLSPEVRETPTRLTDVAWSDDQIRRFLATCGPEMLACQYSM